MASRFTELVVDCHEPEVLGAFWSQVLGYEIERSDEDDDDDVYIEGPPGSGPGILFTRVPEGKTVKNRLHIDVSPTDQEQPQELERLLELGATRADVGQGDDVTWVVLADPEGNEFCLLRTRRP